MSVCTKNAIYLKWIEFTEKRATKEYMESSGEGCPQEAESHKRMIDSASGTYL